MTIVTEITTTLPAGVRPTEDLVFPKIDVQDGTTIKTNYVVERVTITGDIVTSTITPGVLPITSIPEPEPGQPAGIWYFPEGPKPSRETITSTTTFDRLPRPTKDVIIPGPEPAPGGSEVMIEIPAVGKEFSKPDDWSCPCNSEPEIKIVTRPPEPAPTVEAIGANGSVTTAPASKFPCSKDDLNPCRGKQAQGWTSFSVVWDYTHVRPDPPAPFVTTSNFDYDTILTLTDDIYQAEHFLVKMDGKDIGETHEDGWKNEKLYCGKDAEACMAKGFSHGSFPIPAGKHELSFEWTKGEYKTTYGSDWWYGAGQYRFDRPCECGEKSDL